jgi:hypothetical protein
MTAANPQPITVPPNAGSWKPATPSAWDKGAGLFGGGAATANFTGSELVFRGDRRDPNTIGNAGGLWSHNFMTSRNTGADAYDPNEHQKSGGNTRLVSFARDVTVAKGFAGSSGYVYLARVNVGVDYNAFVGSNASQSEVMAVQGIALRDIYAVRIQNNGRILRNTNFVGHGIPQNALATALVLLQS